MKTFIAIFIMLVGLIGLATMTPAVVSAAGSTNCTSSFLGFPAWYRGLTNQDQGVAGSNPCDIVGVNDMKGSDDTAKLSKFIWTIVLNCIEIVVQMVMYITVFFIIIGGFKFMTANGDAQQAASARKTIMTALIGLVMTIIAVAAVNFIVNIINTGKPF